MGRDQCKFVIERSASDRKPWPFGADGLVGVKGPAAQLDLIFAFRFRLDIPNAAARSADNRGNEINVIRIHFPPINTC
jgi:hypothetical protein